MHLLFLAPAYPLPANNGLNMRTWALLRGLAAEGHRVTLLAFAQQQESSLAHPDELEAVCDTVEVVALPLPHLSSTTDLPRRFRSVFSNRPYGVTRFRSSAMRRRISTWLAGDNLDAIVCDPYTFVNLPTTGINVPILLDTQNVEHIILRRYLDHAHNPVKLAYAWLQWRKLKAWEAYVCQRSTLITACSEADRRILQNLSPDVPTLVVPNIVDVDSYSPSPQAENLSVLFQGGMDWYPNRDAVAFFISSILPRLRFLVPGVRFIVAGRNPAEHFLQRFLGVPDVEFTGTIPDMRVEMAKAAVCAVPLRIGSGTRLKILEAAAMGKAIVSTSIGAEGLTFVDAEDIVIADDPGAFAEALVRLLTDPSLRRLLGRRARRRVEVEYGFANLQQGIRQVFEELACRASTVARNAGPQDAVSGT